MAPPMMPSPMMPTVPIYHVTYNPLVPCGRRVRTGVGQADNRMSPGVNLPVDGFETVHGLVTICGIASSDQPFLDAQNDPKAICHPAGSVKGDPLENASFPSPWPADRDSFTRVRFAVVCTPSYLPQWMSSLLARNGHARRCRSWGAGSTGRRNTGVKISPPGFKICKVSLGRGAAHGAVARGRVTAR